MIPLLLSISHLSVYDQLLALSIYMFWRVLDAGMVRSFEVFPGISPSLWHCSGRDLALGLNVLFKKISGGDPARLTWVWPFVLLLLYKQVGSAAMAEKFEIGRM